MKLLSQFTLLLGLLLGTAAMQAREISQVLSRDFISSPNVFVIDSEANTTQYVTSNKEKFTLLSAVKEEWPNKKVKLITRKEYEAMPTVDLEFFFTIQQIPLPKSKVKNANHTRLLLQKGKTATDEDREVYWMSFSLKEVKKNIVAERLLYALNAIKYCVEHNDDESIRTKQMYKIADFDKLIVGHRLLIKKNTLVEKLQIIKELNKVYDGRFKIATDEEWERAIKQQMVNTMFIDIIKMGEKSSINIYTAIDGKLLVSLYPWKEAEQPISSAFFEKVFK